MRTRLNLLRAALREISQECEDWGTPTHAAEIAKAALEVDDVAEEAKEFVEEVEKEKTPRPNCPTCKQPMVNTSSKYGGVKLFTCMNRSCFDNHHYHEGGTRAYGNALAR